MPLWSRHPVYVLEQFRKQQKKEADGRPNKDQHFGRADIANFLCSISPEHLKTPETAAEKQPRENEELS
jgi:hypothetical protein